MAAGSKKRLLALVVFWSGLMVALAGATNLEEAPSSGASVQLLYSSANGDWVTLEALDWSIEDEAGELEEDFDPELHLGRHGRCGFVMAPWVRSGFDASWDSPHQKLLAAAPKTSPPRAILSLQS